MRRPAPPGPGRKEDAAGVVGRPIIEGCVHTAEETTGFPEVRRPAPPSLATNNNNNTTEEEAYFEMAGEEEEEW